MKRHRMNRTPPLQVRRSRARAIAIPQEDRVLALIHLLLALLAPLLIMALTGCRSNENGEPVDYGPEAAAVDINEALFRPLEGVNPLAIKVGAYVQFTTTQKLAGGQVMNRLSDTGMKVIDREEDDSAVIYRIRQDKATYGNDNKTDIVSTDFPFGISKDNGTSNASVQSALVVAPLELLEQSVPALLKSLDVASSTKVRQAATRVTYHRLVTSERDEPPPSEVQAQPGCLGIPNCKIKVHHIEFDQVAWGGSEPERVHFELTMSPDVPMLAGLYMSPLFEYYPGLLKSCVTLMVAIGDGSSKTLLTECNEVEFFRFESPAQ